MEAHFHWKVFPSPPYPWGEWFYSNLVWGWNWPVGYYWCFKIAPSGGHGEQLAIRSDETRKSVQYKILKDRTYIITDPGDTPNWGSEGSVSVGAPCSNWRASVFITPSFMERAQTWQQVSAVQADRENEFNIESAVAKTDYLELDIEALVQGNPYLELDIGAAVQGDAELSVRARAAIRGERELAPEVEAAVAHDFELYPEVEAAVQGNPSETVRVQAAILGETELEYNVVALVLKDRTEAIILEFENNWPQVFDQRSVPNWPSKARHWGRDPIQ